MNSELDSVINYTLGAAFAGYALSCVLLGVFFAQVVGYWVRYPRDRWIYKALVFGVCAIEVVDQVLISHALYYYNITHFNSVSTLYGPVIWSIILHTSVGATVGVITKFCFAVRVWRFSKHNLLITGLIVSLNLAELGLATAFTVKSFHNRKFSYLPKIKTLGTISLGCGVMTDILVAVSLCFYLQRLRSGFKQAYSMITTLSIYAVSTGFATSAAGLAVSICYYLMPLNFIFLGLHFLLAKLYGISLLAALNTRRNMDRESTGRSTGNTTTTTINHNLEDRQQDRPEGTDSLTKLPTRASRVHSWRSSSRKSLLRNGSESSLQISEPPFSTPMTTLPEESHPGTGGLEAGARDNHSLYHGDNRSRFSEPF